MTHPLDWIAALIILVLGYLGYRRGFLEELGRLIGLVISSVAAVSFYGDLSYWLQKHVSFSPELLSSVSFVIIFFAYLYTIRLLTKMLQLFILSKGIRWSNKLMGLIFGTLKGLVTVLVILWVLDVMPEQKLVVGIKTHSTAYRHLSGYRGWIIGQFGLEQSVNHGENWIRETLGKQPPLPSDSSNGQPQAGKVLD